MYAQDGKNFEIVCLGQAIVEWDGKYVPFRKALTQVVKCFNGDPSDPDCRFANDLHAMIAIELGLDNWSELKYYPAVGTALDFFHGVDALFVFRGTVVTIDGTIRKMKAHPKADVVIGLEWSKGELEALGARAIAACLLDKGGDSVRI